MGLTVRMVLRLLAAIAVAATAGSDAVVVAVGAALAAAFVGCRAVDVIVLGGLRRRRTPAVDVRNVPLPGLTVPSGPPVPLLGTALMCLPELLLTAPLCFPDVGRALQLVPMLAGIVVVQALTAFHVRESRRIGRRLSSEAMRRHVQKFLDRTRPEVVLYSGDSQTSAYQVKMWLSTVEQLDEKAVVLLRNRGMFDAIGMTSLPVICAPDPVDLMTLDLSMFRVALYTANIGNNIHLLRVPGIQSAFIGHGDSDKAASFNPFTRVYNEVWVAGPAGRDRYRTADVGVRDDQVVEVGRPQLDTLAATVARNPDHVPTVLYAPTWEGWIDERSHSSVAEQGRKLAAAALAEGSGVRFVYKPHPFAGRRDASMRRAHEDIVRMVAEANRRAGHDVPPSVRWPQLDPLAAVEDPAARTELSAAEGFLPAAAEVEERGRAAEAEYWAALPPAAHVVVTEDGPSLFSCFLESDVLVTDLSSVLSDYQVTGRPYAVCNMSGLPEPEFQESAPSARGATIIAPDGTGIEEILGVARGDREDVRVALRSTLRSYLLGDGTGPSMPRFQAAVSRLARTAKDRAVPPAEAAGLDESERGEPLDTTEDGAPPLDEDSVLA
jgi:hypothetical protein